MRKKLFAILMITAMITAFGPLELFAGTEDGAPSDTGEDIVMENPEDGGEDVDATPAEEPTKGETGEEGDGDTPEEPTEPEFQAISELENIEAVPTDKTVDLSWTVKEGEALAEGETLTIWNGSEPVGEITDINQTSYTVVDLERLTNYTFVFKVGEKEVGSVDVTTTITEIKLEALSSFDSVVVKWNSVEGAEKYVVTYSGNGVDNKELYRGAALKVTHGNVWGSDVVNTKKGPEVKTDYTYNVKAYDAAGNEIGANPDPVKGYAVRTMYYKLSFKKGATLTSHSGGSVKTTFTKGQVVYAKGFDGGRFIFDYRCADGKVRTYYTLKIRVNSAIWNDHIDIHKTYSKEEAELYVNARGITANQGKKYMIWVNTYTQKEYVFSGTTGKWKYLRGPWTVSTGKATKPTATGATNISSRKKRKNGITSWNICRYFSLHGKQKSWVLGYPRSGACVRHYDACAIWIYNNIPLRTRVFVY